MMKKILSVAAAALMTVMALTSSMSVSAVDVVATGDCGDNVTWSLDSDGVLTISGTGNMYGINERYSYTYSNWTYSAYADQIKEVVIEEGVTSIGPCAFGRTSKLSYATDKVAYPNLTKISLPSTIEVIGQGAFLATVITNLSVPKNVKRIQSYAFQYSLIESAVISDGTILEAGSFCDCRNLKEVTVGANCTYTHGAGWGSENHAEDIFYFCNALEKVTILGSGTVNQRFTTIEKGLPDTMFCGCTALKEVRILAKDLEYVGKVNSNSNVNTETFPAKGTSTVQYSTNINYYVYKDSTTESTLREAGYFTDENVTYFAETEALEAAIAKAEEIDKTKYTEETVSVFTAALDTAKAVLENPDATQEEVDDAVKALNDAMSGLKEKSAPTEPEPTKSEPTKPNPTVNTPAKTKTKATRNPQAVKKDKASAKKAMKQAKITKLKAKSKTKKINVSWKKVKKAKGYQVQLSAKKNFKKLIFKKDLKKTKLTIKNKKIKSKKTYFVRVRAYATYKDANNKTVKVYSKWNKKLRKITVK